MHTKGTLQSANIRQYITPNSGMDGAQSGHMNRLLAVLPSDLTGFGTQPWQNGEFLYKGFFSDSTNIGDVLKKTTFQKLPKYLTFLNHYNMVPLFEGDMKIKDAGNVHCVYELTGVSRNLVASKAHFDALVKRGNQWYHCDDFSIKEIDEDKVNQMVQEASSCILNYRLK